MRRYGMVAVTSCRTILGANMADEYAWTIRGSQPRNEEERSKRKIFLGYLEALPEPVDMKSRFAASFWPHDLLPGDQRPPEGAGIEAMEQIRERINSACTTVRGGAAGSRAGRAKSGHAFPAVRA